MRTLKFRSVILLAVILSLSAVDVGVVAQQKKTKQVPRGTAVMWERPGDISSRDLFLVRRREHASRSAAHYFHKRGEGWLLEEYRVRDAPGHEWVAKIGEEAQSETSAIRLSVGSRLFNRGQLPGAARDDSGKGNIHKRPVRGPA